MLTDSEMDPNERGSEEEEGVGKTRDEEGGVTPEMRCDLMGEKQPEEAEDEMKEEEQRDCLSSAAGEKKLSLFSPKSAGFILLLLKHLCLFVNIKAESEEETINRLFSQQDISPHL